MRQRLVFDEFQDCILTDEPDSVRGRSVVFGPSRDLPRSWANWQRHKACMVAAPAMADLLEELRRYALSEGEYRYGPAASLEQILQAFDRPEVVALLESIKQ